MDQPTQKALTKALDTAIATVAEEWFAKLSNGLSNQEIAEKTCNALKSLRDLQWGRLPKYDAWDALFYAVWYQPAHINLAYTLARNIPENLNPLRSGKGYLEVFDFGRGALAMNFGLSLASSDFSHETPIRVFVAGGDTSADMQQIGWEIWDCFIEEMCEVKNYPELRSLRRACFNVKVERKCAAPVTRWLTVLHVAYEENVDEVSQNLNDQIKLQRPDVILSTTHKVSEKWLYHPNASIYELHDGLSSELEPSDLMLKGDFEKTSLFRKNLWHTKSEAFSRYLPEDDMSFVRSFLTILPKTWTAKDFESILRVHNKR